MRTEYFIHYTFIKNGVNGDGHGSYFVEYKMTFDDVKEFVEIIKKEECFDSVVVTNFIELGES